ncbi:MAG TPA: glucosaminidase domain-containing protein [Cellvibrionaceae bacterium]
MQKKFTLVVAGLLVYVLVCLILALYLAANPYQPKASGIIHGDTQLPNLAAISDIPTRKQAFIDLLLPMIEAKNAALLEVREHLETLQEKNEHGRAERLRIERLAKRYNIDIDQADTHQLLDDLLLRIDTLPTSMVLAQAAAESGWGTSRFAREGFNLFGQWCYIKGCGIVPRRRPAGARHEVQRFASVEQAVNAYYRNINSHRAYADLRLKRSDLRREGETASGQQLIKSLDRYSSRGQVYIDELAELIRFNQLQRFDP